MKRALWTLAMLITSLVSLAMQPARSLAAQTGDPFPYVCGHSCTTNSSCVAECHLCKSDTAIESGGKTCNAF